MREFRVVHCSTDWSQLDERRRRPVTNGGISEDREGGVGWVWDGGPWRLWGCGGVWAEKLQRGVEQRRLASAIILELSGNELFMMS